IVASVFFSFSPWLCENPERAFTEGNRVLEAPQIPSRLAIAREDNGVGEEDRFTYSFRPSVLKRPRPKAPVDAGGVCLWRMSPVTVRATVQDDVRGVPRADSCIAT